MPTLGNDRVVDVLLTRPIQTIGVVDHASVRVRREAVNVERRAPLVVIRAAADSGPYVPPARWVELHLHEGRAWRQAHIVAGARGGARKDVRVAIRGAGDLGAHTAAPRVGSRLVGAH